MSELCGNLQTVPLLDVLQRQGADIVAGRFTDQEKCADDRMKFASALTLGFTQPGWTVTSNITFLTYTNTHANAIAITYYLINLVSDSQYEKS